MLQRQPGYSIKATAVVVAITAAALAFALPSEPASAAKIPKAVGSPSVPVATKPYNLQFAAGQPIGRIVVWTGGLHNIDIAPATGSIQAEVGGPVPTFRPDELQVSKAGYAQKLPANLEGLDLSGIDVDNKVVQSLVTQCKNLRYLNLSETDIDDSVFAILKAVPKLEALDMKHCSISGSGFNELSQLPNLRYLSLQASTVRPQNYKLLSGAKKLAELRVAECAIDDAACAFIAQLPSLTYLNIARTLVTDKGIANLMPLKNRLDSIDMAHCRVSDPALRTLGQFPKLRLLTLRTESPQPPVTAKGIQSLAGARNLQALDLGFTIKDDVPAAMAQYCPGLVNFSTGDCPNLTDAGFKQLSRLQSVNYLSVASTKCSDGTIEQAAKLRNLQVLLMGTTKIGNTGFKRFCDSKNGVKLIVIDNTQVSDSGLVSLSKLPNLQKINLNGTGVTDASVPHIIKCKKLDNVGLSHTRVTSKGIAQLKTAMPNCRVSFF